MSIRHYLQFKDFSAADKARLTDAYRAMIGDRMMPAFRKLRGFIANDYLPRTRDSVGLNQLPNGDAWYAYKVRSTTTTVLTFGQLCRALSTLFFSGTYLPPRTPSSAVITVRQSASRMRSRSGTSPDISMSTQTSGAFSCAIV